MATESGPERYGARGGFYRAWESRSRAGVAADRCLPSHERTLHKCQAYLEFAKFSKMQNKYAKLLERYFVNFGKKTRMQKAICKTVGDALMHRANTLH